MNQSRSANEAMPHTNEELRIDGRYVRGKTLRVVGLHTARAVQQRVGGIPKTLAEGAKVSGADE